MISCSALKETVKVSANEMADRTNLGHSKAPQNAVELSKKTEALKLDPATPAAPPAPKVRSKGLDVPKLWSEQKSTQKRHASFVVIGHVDHGKSTLMGRLLLDTGAVAQRDIDKYDLGIVIPDNMNN